MKKLKKLAAILLAGLLACFSLTACSDEVEVKPDEPMGPGEILNALKNASDYTVTNVNWSGEITETLKKDGQIVHYTWTMTYSDPTIPTDHDELYRDYSNSSSVVTYSSLNSAAWSKYESASTLDEDIEMVIENFDVLFNDVYYTSTGSGSYTMTTEGLAAIGEDSVTITNAGLVYTIKIGGETITIDFSDVVLTLPTV